MNCNHLRNVRRHARDSWVKICLGEDSFIKSNARTRPDYFPSIAVGVNFWLILFYELLIICNFGLAKSVSNCKCLLFCYFFYPIRDFRLEIWINKLFKGLRSANIIYDTSGFTLIFVFLDYIWKFKTCNSHLGLSRTLRSKDVWGFDLKLFYLTLLLTSKI